MVRSLLAFVISCLLYCGAALAQPGPGPVPQSPNITIGSPIIGTCANGTFIYNNSSVVGCAAINLAVGTSTISGGTSGRVLYDNAGVLGEYAITGTGNVVMSASPTLSGTIGGNLTFSGTTVHSSLVTANAGISIGSAQTLDWNSDLIFGRRAAANLRQGATDVGAIPTPQFFSVQSVVAGTSNTPASNWTFVGSLSTGNAANGDIVFQTGLLGSSGTSQNTATTALTIRGDTQNVDMTTGTALFRNSAPHVPGSNPTGKTTYIGGNSDLDGSITLNAGNGQAWLYNSSGSGAILQGRGSVSDIFFLNRQGSAICDVPAGTNIFECFGPYVSRNNAPTDGGGSCTATNFFGGTSVGQFTAPNCAGGTIKLTFINSLTNGYACFATDKTTPSNTVKQDNYTVNGAEFIATTTNLDIILYHCFGF